MSESRPSAFRRRPPRRATPLVRRAGAIGALAVGMLHVWFSWQRWTYGLRGEAWGADEWVFAVVVSLQAVLAMTAGFAARGGTPRTFLLAASALLPFPVYEGAALVGRAFGGDLGLEPGVFAGSVLLAHGLAIALLALAARAVPREEPADRAPEGSRP